MLESSLAMVPTESGIHVRPSVQFSVFDFVRILGGGELQLFAIQVLGELEKPRKRFQIGGLYNVHSSLYKFIFEKHYLVYVHGI